MSEPLMTFNLLIDQVPDYPNSTKWADHLRWAICVMDTDDPSFPFIASVFAYCLKNEGVTKRQAKIANRVLESLHDSWKSCLLDCLNNEGEIPPEALKKMRELEEAAALRKADLKKLKPEGEA